MASVGNTFRDALCESITHRSEEQALSLLDGELSFQEKELIKDSDDCFVDAIDRTYLHLASERGMTSVVERLLILNADPEARDKNMNTPLHLATRAGFIEVTKVLASIPNALTLSDSETNTALHIAADQESKDLVQILLDANADVAAKTLYSSLTPLHIAAGKGHATVVQSLLAAQADVNALAPKRVERVNKYAPDPDPEPATPLQCAAFAGHRDVVRDLLQANADPNLTNETECTPLHWAATRDRKEVVELLIAANADVNALNQDGLTPTFVAPPDGETRQLLLDNGGHLLSERMRCLRVAYFTIAPIVMMTAFFLISLRSEDSFDRLGSWLEEPATSWKNE